MAGFSLAAAAGYARLAARAYDPARWDFRLDSCEGLVNIPPGAGVVEIAFNGTGNWLDVWRDACWWPRLIPALGCRVHAGMWHEVETAWPWLQRHVFGRAVRDGLGLVFVGHSKGGGAASPAALRAVYEGLPVAGLVTLGAPRVMDRAAARILVDAGVQQLHLWHRGDPVPTMPWLVGGLANILVPPARPTRIGRRRGLRPSASHDIRGAYLATLENHPPA